MKLIQFFFLLLLFIVCQSANAQIPFVAKSFSSNSIKFEKAIDVCELPSGKFVFVGEKTHPDSTCFVFVTDKYGNVLTSKYLFQKTDTSDCIPVNCFFTDDYKISIIGSNYQWGKPKSRTDIFYATIDTALNLLLYNNIKVTQIDTLLTGIGGFVKLENNFYGFYSYSIAPDYLDKTKLIKLAILLILHL